MTKLIKTKDFHDCDEYYIFKEDQIQNQNQIQINSIVWQTGTEKEQGINGLQIVDVIILAIERLLEVDPDLSDWNNVTTLAGLINALHGQALRDGKEEKLKEMLAKEDPSDIPNLDAHHEMIKELYEYEVETDEME